MSHRKLGTCKFILYGTPDSAKSRVDIEAEINDPVIDSVDFLLSRAWLLMLESQIGKVPRPIQDLVIDTLSGQTLVYFKYGTPPTQVGKTPDMHHLATLEIELCFGNKLFVLAYMRDFDRHFRAEGLAGLIMINSFSTICNMLQTASRDGTLCALIYGLHKWEAIGRPGAMTAFTETWDFQSAHTMIEQGKELIQKGWKTKSRELIAPSPRHHASPAPMNDVSFIGRFAGCGAILIVIGAVGACLPLFGYKFRLLTATSESLGLPEICVSGLFVVAGLAIIAAVGFIARARN